MSLKNRIELCIMMFLEFFIWGAWFVTMGTYLGKIGFQGTEIGWAYGTMAWAAIVSPFFVGMIADRFFAAQKVMGVAQLLGAALLYWASTITSFSLFFWVLLAYALCYTPTIALANAIAFNLMKDPEREFPPIRVLGTAGWIAAGLFISFVLGRMVEGVEATALPMQMGAIASAVLGVYSFFLPNTPPKSLGKKITAGDILGIEAFKLLKDPSFAVFIAGSLLICIPLAFYYSFANLFFNELGMTNVAAKQSMGQMSEVVFMLLMPFFLTRLGIKKTLLLGMLAWVVRYVLFAYGNIGPLAFMLYIGILLHGICYDFFFVTGQIYVEKQAPKAIQASAQGFFALVTYGAGLAIGNVVAGAVSNYYQITQIKDGVETVVGHHWREIWLAPAAMALVVIVLFAVFFREPNNAGKNGAR